MRLARSYEELRGRDIEGFVGFIRDQQALGASQLEAVSEEEGADAVRLLTIHAAKGLEFKVVIVADAGRDTGGVQSADEILVRPDGTFGFRVIDPKSGKKRGVFSYEEVREAEKQEDDGRAAAPLLRRDDARDRPADRLGRDRSGAPAGPGHADRLGALAARSRRRARERRARARRGALRAGCRPVGAAAGRRAAGARRGRSRAARALRRAADGAAPRGYRLPELPPLPVPPLHRVRRLSYSALALFERCSYRYYAERIAGLREERATMPGGARPQGDRDRRRGAPPARARRPARPGSRPTVEIVRAWYPGVGDDELERIDAFVASLLRVGARRRGSRRSTAPSPSGPSRSSTTACCCTAGSTCSGATARGRSSSTTRRTRWPRERPRRSSRPTTGCSASSTRWRASAPAPTRSRSSTTSSSGPTRSSRRRFDRLELPALEAELSAAIRRIDAGEFVPTPSDFTCAGCPALDLVCAGPNLRQPPGRLVAAA